MPHIDNGQKIIIFSLFWWIWNHRGQRNGNISSINFTNFRSCTCHLVAAAAGAVAAFDFWFVGIQYLNLMDFNKSWRRSTDSWVQWLFCTSFAQGLSHVVRSMYSWSLRFVYCALWRSVFVSYEQITSRLLANCVIEICCCCCCFGEWTFHSDIQRMTRRHNDKKRRRRRRRNKTQLNAIESIEYIRWSKYILIDFIFGCPLAITIDIYVSMIASLSLSLFLSIRLPFFVSFSFNRQLTPYAVYTNLISIWNYGISRLIWVKLDLRLRNWQTWWCGSTSEWTARQVTEHRKKTKTFIQSEHWTVKLLLWIDSHRNPTKKMQSQFIWFSI